MADTADQPEKKPTHAPAEKMAGGVRIARKEKRSESAAAEPNDDFEADEPEVSESQTTLAKAMKESYPEEAVRACHEKPLPTHQPQNKHQPRTSINQPRKQ